MEAVSGTVGRGFAAAEVSGDSMLTAALTPDWLELVGRSLMREGEAVFVIRTDGGMLKLLPAETVDVTGGPDPESWVYRITAAGPSYTQTFTHLPAEGVIHVRYASDTQRPWHGNSPLDVASLTGKLSRELSNALGDEVAGPRGQLYPMPEDGDATTTEQMRTGIRNAKGRIAFVQGGDHGGAPGGGVMPQTPMRYGAAPPAPLVELMEKAAMEVYAACGLNSAIWGGGDAASVREAWRLLLFGVLSPLGVKVEAELRLKLGPVSLAWQELRASDLSGRSRAFSGMVQSGATIESAAAVAGLDGLVAAPTPAPAEGGQMGE